MLCVVTLILLLQVNSDWAADRHAEAYAASRIARNLNLISCFCHIPVLVMLIIIIVSVSA